MAILKLQNSKYSCQPGLVAIGPTALCSAQSGDTSSMRVAISASALVAKHSPAAGLSRFRSFLFGMTRANIRRSSTRVLEPVHRRRA